MESFEQVPHLTEHLKFSSPFIKELDGAWSGYYKTQKGNIRSEEALFTAPLPFSGAGGQN